MKKLWYAIYLIFGKTLLDVGSEIIDNFIEIMGEAEAMGFKKNTRDDRECRG